MPGNCFSVNKIRNGNTFGICWKPKKLFSWNDYWINVEPGIYSGFLFEGITLRRPHIEHFINGQQSMPTPKNPQYCNTIWYTAECTYQTLICRKNTNFLPNMALGPKLSNKKLWYFVPVDIITILDCMKKKKIPLLEFFDKIVFFIKPFCPDHDMRHSVCKPTHCLSVKIWTRFLK